MMFFWFSLKFFNFWSGSAPGLYRYRYPVSLRQVSAFSGLRVHLLLVVAVAGNRAAGYSLRDAPQVLVDERHVRGGGVLLQALAAFGAGDGNCVVAPWSSQ